VWESGTAPVVDSLDVGSLRLGDTGKNCDLTHRSPPVGGSGFIWAGEVPLALTVAEGWAGGRVALGDWSRSLGATA